MLVAFYNHSKRVNSTKLPTSQQTTIECQLKEDTNVSNPSLLLRSEGVPTWRYCSIPSFGRYYFIANWTYEKGLWRADCTTDLLATARSSIFGKKFFVAYSTSIKIPDIVDNRIYVKPTFKQTKVTIPFNEYHSGGYYFLRCTGKQNPVTEIYRNGFCPLYILTPMQMFAFVESINADGVFEAISQYFTRPMDGFVECYWLPFIPAEFSSIVTTNVIIGGHLANACTAVSSELGKMFKKTQTVEIPWRYTDFRNNEPYTSLEFYSPWTGRTPIKASDVYKSKTLVIDYSLDVISGDISFKIKHEDGKVLNVVTGNCKVTLPLSSITTNVAGVAGGVATALVGAGMSVAGAVATGGASIPLAGVGTMLGGLFTATSSASQTLTTNMGSIAGSTNACSLFELPYISLTAQDTIDPLVNADIAGYPVGSTNTIFAGMTGYLQTSGASISSSVLSEGEMKEVNAMLDSGIYLE